MSEPSMNHQPESNRSAGGNAGEPSAERIPVTPTPAERVVNTAGLQSGVEELPVGNETPITVLTRSPVPDTRAARVVWILLAVVFLSAAALALWFFSRTHARTGAGWETVHHLDTAADTDDARPLGLPPKRGNPVGNDPVENDPVDWQPTADRADSPVMRADVDTDADSGTDGTGTDGTADSSAGNGSDNIVYYRRRNDNMEIALSFDDGPHPRYTPEILSILEEYGVTATFFMVGENVLYYPEAAAAVLAAGHEIGNHSTTHRRLSGLSESDVRREILGCEEALATLGEYRPHLLRPPEGRLSRTVRKLTGEMDYRIILWDIDTRDWAHTPPATIAQNILDSVQAGDIILMHDYIGKDSPTPEALRLVLPELLKRGYHFVTVSRLIDGA